MKEKRRLKGKKLILYRISLILKSTFFFFIVAISGFILTTFLFFKVQNVDCVGEVSYSKDEIISNSNLKIGSNLLFLSTKKSEKIIEEKFSYLSNVRIVKKFPDKLIINVEEAKKYLNVNFNNENIILSDKFKVLNIYESNSDFDAGDAIEVKGLKLKNFEVGKIASFYDDNNENNFLSLLDLLKEFDLIEKIKLIDFSDPLNIIINYDNRINMKMGTFEKVDYKFRTAKELINNKISDLEKGDLDLSKLSNGNRSYFNPEV